MSGGVSGQISKGIVHQKVDRVLNDHRRAGFLAALKKAKTSPEYLAMLENQAVMGQDFLTRAEARYLQETWYNEDPATGWWWQAQPIYSILRQGLLKAIIEADKAPTLPVESYWLPVTTGNLVAVLIARGERQVTRLIITPPSPTLDQEDRKPVSLWAVKRGYDGFPKDEEEELTPFPDDVEGLIANVKVWRRKERSP